MFPRKVIIRLTSALLGAVVVVAALASPARADVDTDAQREAAAASAQARADVKAALAALSAANANADAAQTALDEALGALGEAQDAWQAAQVVEAKKAIELYKADQALVDAQARVTEGEAKIATQNSLINAYARSLVQDNIPMIGVAALLNGESTASLADRVQWIDTVLYASKADLDVLKTLQAQLVADQAAAAAAQQTAEAAKHAAEQQTDAARQVELRAEQAADAVSAAVSAQRSAALAAGKVLSDNQKRLATATANEAALNAKIAAETLKAQEAAKKAQQATPTPSPTPTPTPKPSVTPTPTPTPKPSATPTATTSTPTPTPKPSATPTPTPKPSATPTPTPTPSATPTPKPTPTTPSAAPSLSPAQAQAAAYGMIKPYGWDDKQFQCLVNLWNRESSWRWWAKNPSSGAYGIPQSLPATKMASAGADWETNAITQIAWGLDYISWRYTNPCGAWAHSEKYNWY